VPNIAASACLSPLFVPGDRPDRFEKAAASGADAVIVDLEDAVAPEKKAEARAHVKALKRLAVPVFVRVNAPSTEWHNEDLRALKGVPIEGVVVPKTQNPSEAASVSSALGERGWVIALIESALGLAQARDIALARGVKRLAFGSLDFAVDLGCAHIRESLLAARSELVLASRLAGLNGPIDGVTTSIDNMQAVEDDAAFAAALGFAGKLCIHPKQVAAVKKGFAPTEDEVSWAKKIAAASAEGGAVKVAGTMVDAPVRMRAEQILRRAGQ
jgi:citrate lyase subunit beta/citryl-CoA lyase